jgi:hypothetical protein
MIAKIAAIECFDESRGGRVRDVDRRSTILNINFADLRGGQFPHLFQQSYNSPSCRAGRQCFED